MDRKIVEQLIIKKSFNKISKLLHVSKKRIKKVYVLAKERGYLSGTKLPPYPQSIFDYSGDPLLVPVSEVDKELDEHLQWIKDRRGAGWSLITIWEELPIEVNRSSFYRFVKRNEADIDREKIRCRLKVSPEIIYELGEALLLDWGKMYDVIDSETGKTRTLWFLSGVMGHSRYLMTRFVWSNSTEETLRAISSMFNELGGVPRKITSDNPKCFATKASKYEALLNPAFERFCSHYEVIAELLPPREPKKKGKIERMIPYVRRLFEAHGEWKGIEDAQRYIDRKMVLANERRHGTTKLRPIDVFLQQESTVLKELPTLAYTIEEYHFGKVRKDGHVRFRDKYYSVDKEYIGENVFVIGNEDRVELFIKGDLVETHARVTSNFKSKSTKKYHLSPAEQVMQNSEHLLNRALSIGENVHQIVEAILLRSCEIIDARKVWGILNLDKDYDRQQVNTACKYALECNKLSYRGVLHFITYIPTEEKIIKQSTQNKFTRDPCEYEEQFKQ